MKPYNESVEHLITALKSDMYSGLTKQEADKRLSEHGLNSLPEEQKEIWALVFLRQFQNPLIYILLCAAAIIFFFGDDALDAAIISGVLFFNAIIGTIQEGKTRTILESLKRLIKSSSLVIRDGHQYIIPDTDLVVGDIIELKEGQRVPADARIIFSHAMQVDESLLTGESKPRFKIAKPLEGDHIIAEQDNMVFQGTYITAGYGRAIVIATGEKTEIGKIHRTIEEIKTEMPLKKEVDRLAFIILIFILIVCFCLFGIGVIAGKPLAELLVMLTALFICVVPEGLPVVLTLVLVSGVYRLAKQQVLVKNLQAVEALGRSNIIIIDKTGTLTRNEMMISSVWCADRVYHISGKGYQMHGSVHDQSGQIIVPQQKTDNSLYQLATASLLLSDVEITEQSPELFTLKGDPTDAALEIFGYKIIDKVPQLIAQYQSVYDMPFTPSVQYHSHFFKHQDEGVVFIAGAPEVIISRLSEPTQERLQAALSEFLNEGLRVIALGVKKYKVHDFEGKSLEEKHAVAEQYLESGIALLGLVGMQDTIRDDIADMVKTARDAGLHIVMATGDHKKTAQYVAQKVGIYQQGDYTIDGAHFAHKSDTEMLSALGKTTVYARVSPDDKLRLVRLFHKQGNIVAMTGDGINDAPALVAADLGIAMGRIGAEVAKQAADIILLDDSFLHIINAIKQGRHIFYTLKRVVLYFFATNMGEILIVLFALILNAIGIHFPLPITAAQILWLNLVTDGFLDVALSMEPQEPDLLKKHWLTEKQQLVDVSLLLKMFFIAIPMGIAGLIVFYLYYQESLVLARTMTLITLAMFQWFNAWNCRSMRRSIFQLGIFTNKWLLLATLFVLFLQILVVYAPWMNYIFKTTPLAGEQWLLVFALSAPIILLEEIRKIIVRKLWPNL